MLIAEILEKLMLGDPRALAKAITLVENELNGHLELLSSLKFLKKTPIIGITGPPGAGKSTIVNALISKITGQVKKVAVLAVDPTSPFNYGSILGDRIRMAEHFNNENVFIRSIATRGSLGGLSTKTIEITDLMKASNFDYIIVETVGVGQSEVEIVGLADTTVLVLVPESGDEVQSLKSGIMEIADIFVVNKCDRPGADLFHKNLLSMLHEQKLKDWNPPIVKTIASKIDGVEELLLKMDEHQQIAFNTKRTFLLTEKAYRLIQNKKMKLISKKELFDKISELQKDENFNLYKLVEKF